LTGIDINKYDVKKYRVITEDQYLLTMFRVRLNDSEFKNLTPERQANRIKPVLLIHGLGNDSACWVSDEGSNSVGNYLLLQGYDVWLANSRGTRWSRARAGGVNHDYFKYSFQEMGLYDTPAYYDMIQDAYDNPNQKIIVGAHSRGTSSFFAALLDEKTQDLISKNTVMFFAFAPVVYMTHFPNSAARDGIHFLPIVEPLLQKLKVDWLCGDGCGGSDDGYCVQDVLHLGQLINGKGDLLKKESVFRKYDYGESGNEAKYGQKTPPEWNVSDFPDVKLIIQSNGNDELVSPTDVKLLEQALEGKIDGQYEIPGWGHNDIITNENKQPIFDILDKYLGLKP